MTFTSFRLTPVSSEAAANVAKPAKTPLEPVIEAPTFATFTAFAVPRRQNSAPADWHIGFARLEALPTPQGVGATAWREMIGPARAFLDQWGGNAHALGWTAGELFGLDLDKPFGRRDRRGAAFFLADAIVVAVTNEAITLRVGKSLQGICRRGELTHPVWEEIQDTTYANVIENRRDGGSS